MSIEDHELALSFFKDDVFDNGLGYCLAWKFGEAYFKIGPEPDSRFVFYLPLPNSSSQWAH